MQFLCQLTLCSSSLWFVSFLYDESTRDDNCTEAEVDDIQYSLLVCQDSCYYLGNFIS